jgi:hypothetical protein
VRAKQIQLVPAESQPSILRSLDAANFRVEVSDNGEGIDLGVLRLLGRVNGAVPCNFKLIAIFLTLDGQ